MARRRKSDKGEPAPVPALSGEFGRWLNDTGRNVSVRLGGVLVDYWPQGSEKSVPEEHSSEALAAGLTRVR